MICWVESRLWPVVYHSCEVKPWILNFIHGLVDVFIPANENWVNWSNAAASCFVGRSRNFNCLQQNKTQIVPNYVVNCVHKNCHHRISTNESWQMGSVVESQYPSKWIRFHCFSSSLWKDVLFLIPTCENLKRKSQACTSLNDKVFERIAHDFFTKNSKKECKDCAFQGIVFDVRQLKKLLFLINV